VGNLELYKHQKAALVKSAGKKQFAFLMDMGTGKSATALFQARSVDAPASPVLIITYKSIISNWEKEIIKWVKFSNSDRKNIVQLVGSKAKKIKLLKETEAHYYMINYDAIHSILKELLAKGFAVIILDESTAIKNPKAKRTKAAMKLGENIEQRYILTGSPIINNPLDLFTQFYFLDPDIIGFYSFWAFKNCYAIMVNRKFGKKRFKEIVGYRNMDELKDKIEPYSFFVRIEDCLDMPEKIYEVREIEMPEETKKLYDTLSDKLVAEISKDVNIVANNVLTKGIRLQQLLGGNAVVEELAGEDLLLKRSIDVEENKSKETLKILEEIKGKKAIIWCVFVYEIIRLKEILSKAGYRVLTYYGGTEDRDANYDKILKGEYDVVIGNTVTGGYGNDFTSANYEIFFSNDHRGGERLQGERRVWRHGQNERVVIIDLITKGTLEKGILEVLKEKKEWTDKIRTPEDIEKFFKGE